MIEFSKYILNNGLRVLLHRDGSTPLATVNILYQAGARDEQPRRTGFAHLFEHLMFGGTERFPDFDLEVDRLGGESNAFTNNDYTNYYMTVPADALPQALELEADRMFRPCGDGGHRFGSKTLEVQRRVVTEEYNQRYMNQPYGDVWMHLRPLCYRQHPYRWCTIGADIRHVQEASLEEVEDFFGRWYAPANAILALAGNIGSDEEAMALVRKYFDTPAAADPMRVQDRSYPAEPEQTESRRLALQRQVPANAIYKAWVMGDRWSRNYYACDMLSDVLSNGDSSRMYRHLVQEQGLFSEVNAYIMGDLGPGLFVMTGKLCDGVDFDRAEAALARELHALQEQPIDEHEMQKVKNKFENTFVYSQYKNADRAQSLCYYEMIGHAEWVNTEPENYRDISAEEVRAAAAGLSEERCSTLCVSGI